MLRDREPSRDLLSDLWDDRVEKFGVGPAISCAQLLAIDLATQCKRFPDLEKLKLLTKKLLDVPTSTD
jgi:hypothetical protein